METVRVYYVVAYEGPKPEHGDRPRHELGKFFAPEPAEDFCHLVASRRRDLRDHCVEVFDEPISAQHLAHQAKAAPIKSTPWREVKAQ